MALMQRAILNLSATALLACVVGVGAPLPSSARAQTAAQAGPAKSAIDYHSKSRTLTVHLNGMPLRQVMDDLARQTHIRFQPPPPEKEFDSRPVTASFERMPIERAIKQLLGPSNTAMLYGTAPHSGSAPRLMEVRVLDMGVIPVVATNDEPAPSPPPLLRMTPEQLQARREAAQKRREERLQARRKEGGRGRRGRTVTQPAQEQSSGQSAENGEKGSKPSDGGQSSGGASKPNESGGKP